MLTESDHISLICELFFYILGLIVSAIICGYTVYLARQRPSLFNLYLILSPFLLIIYFAFNIKTIWIIYFFQGGYGHTLIENSIHSTDDAYEANQLWKQNDYYAWIILGILTLCYILVTQWRFYECRKGLSESDRRKDIILLIFTILIFIPTNIVLIWGYYFQTDQSSVAIYFSVWAIYVLFVDTYISASFYRELLRLRADLQDITGSTSVMIREDQHEINKKITWTLICTCGVMWINILGNIFIRYCFFSFLFFSFSFPDHNILITSKPYQISFSSLLPLMLS